MGKKDSRFRKYEFDNEAEAQSAIDSLHVEDQPNPYTGLVKLGFIQTKAGQYDADGNETKAPTYSNKYSIDIFWKEAELDGWKGKKIKLNGNKISHTFLGIDYADD